MATFPTGIKLSTSLPSARRWTPRQRRGSPQSCSSRRRHGRRYGAANPTPKMGWCRTNPSPPGPRSFDTAPKRWNALRRIVSRRIGNWRCLRLWHRPHGRDARGGGAISPPAGNTAKPSQVGRLHERIPADRQPDRNLIGRGCSSVSKILMRSTNGARGCRRPSNQIELPSEGFSAMEEEPAAAAIATR